MAELTKFDEQIGERTSELVEWGKAQREFRKIKGSVHVIADVLEEKGHEDRIDELEQALGVLEDVKDLVDEKEHEKHTELRRAKRRKAEFEAEKDKQEDIERAKEFLEEYTEGQNDA